MCWSVGSGDARCVGSEKGLILFAKLKKLWLTCAGGLQEDGLLKANTLECSRGFKSHHSKVGQLIADGSHLEGVFDPKCISDNRKINIINETLY